MMKVVLIRNDQGDWEGLYLNGKCVAQGHTIDTPHVLAALGIECEQHEVDMGDRGHLPYDLESALEDLE